MKCVSPRNHLLTVTRITWLLPLLFFYMHFFRKKKSSFKLFLNFVLFMSVTRPLNSPGPKELWKPIPFPRVSLGQIRAWKVLLNLVPDLDLQNTESPVMVKSWDYMWMPECAILFYWLSKDTLDWLQTVTVLWRIPVFCNLYFNIF